MVGMTDLKSASESGNSYHGYVDQNKNAILLPIDQDICDF